jgi:tRNA 2-selenouridine synthase
MSSHDNTRDFLPLFLNDTPLMDVRAPVEFMHGSFPGAVNLPLINDEERRKIGLTYKNDGQDAAVKLGHKLVSGEIKAARIASWVDFAKKHPEGRLFCFRGGMRSHIVQQWMREAGVDYPLIPGGYKALRRFLIDSFESQVAARRFFIISGRTGTGKTTVLNGLDSSVDLEAMARHRGSSFGRRIAPQPGQIDFENAIAVRLLKLSQAEKPLFVEDESRVVGRCALPPSLMNGMKSWPMVVVEESLEKRVARVHKDYVTDMLAEHVAAYGDEGFERYIAYLTDSLSRIRNRLGGERHQYVLALMENAFMTQRKTGSDTLHRIWIEELLVNYYDPMYDYQIAKKGNRILFRGSQQAVLNWCQSRK